MVVCVLAAGLEHVVVYVRDAALGLDLVYAHGLKLQIGHCAGRVLGQRLVYAYSYLAPRRHVPVDEVAGY